MYIRGVNAVESIEEGFARLLYVVTVIVYFFRNNLL